MLRLLMIALLANSFIYAQTTQQQIEDFFNNTLDKKSVKEVHVIDTKPLDYPVGWSAYFINVEYSVKDKDIVLIDVVFSDNISISRDFTNIKTKKSTKQELLEEFNNNIKKRE